MHLCYTLQFLKFQFSAGVPSLYIPSTFSLFSEENFCFPGEKQESGRENWNDF